MIDYFSKYLFTFFIVLSQLKVYGAIRLFILFAIRKSVELSLPSELFRAKLSELLYDKIRVIARCCELI